MSIPSVLRIARYSYVVIVNELIVSKTQYISQYTGVKISKSSDIILSYP